MRNTEQPQTAQYNWRTCGAVSHTNKEKNMNNGTRVRVRIEGNFEDREGNVTSIGNEALPVHVTLDGDNWETDFRADELEAI